MRQNSRRRWPGGRWILLVGLLAAALGLMVQAADTGAQVGAATQPGKAGDWPQWRGPNRDGISAETAWASAWSDSKPKVLWKAPVGVGYSAAAVAGKRVYTMGRQDDKETVWCLNADTGKPIWSRSYPSRKGGYPGTRATPTVDGRHVFTLGRNGHVCCFQAADGKPVWSKDLRAELKAATPGWGFASSPLVEGNLLILNMGTAGVALNKATGKVVWQTGRGKAGHASPVAYKDGNERRFLIFAANGLVSVSARTGQRRWALPWKTSYDVHASDPIVSDGMLFMCSGYGTGCALLKLGPGRPTPLWSNKDLAPHFGSPVLYKGHLYGVHGNVGNAAVRCIEFKTGKVKWTGPRTKMSSLMLADGKLIVMVDGGGLLVAEASPEKFNVLGKTRVLSGTCWTMPVLAAGRIYCRSHSGELACVDVSKK